MEEIEEKKISEQLESTEIQEDENDIEFLNSEINFSKALKKVLETLEKNEKTDINLKIL